MHLTVLRVYLSFIAHCYTLGVGWTNDCVCHVTCLVLVSSILIYFLHHMYCIDFPFFTYLDGCSDNFAFDSHFRSFEDVIFTSGFHGIDTCGLFLMRWASHLHQFVDVPSSSITATSLACLACNHGIDKSKTLHSDKIMVPSLCTDHFCEVES